MVPSNIRKPGIFKKLSGWRALPLAAAVAAFSLFFLIGGVLRSGRKGSFGDLRGDVPPLHIILEPVLSRLERCLSRRQHGPRRLHGVCGIVRGDRELQLDSGLADIHHHSHRHQCGGGFGNGLPQGWTPPTSTATKSVEDEASRLRGRNQRIDDPSFLEGWLRSGVGSGGIIDRHYRLLATGAQISISLEAPLSVGIGFVPSWRDWHLRYRAGPFWLRGGGALSP